MRKPACIRSRSPPIVTLAPAMACRALSAMPSTLPLALLRLPFCSSSTFSGSTFHGSSGGAMRTHATRRRAALGSGSK